MVAPPSTTSAPKLSASARLPPPAVTTTIAHAAGSARAPSAAVALRALGLRVHVRDLDAADRAARGAERERAARIVGVDVHLQRRAVADDEQRVAELLELGFELVGVEALALDDEHGAVAVARQLLVDRFEAELAVVLGRRRQRHGRSSAASMPRTISTSPAAPASTTPASVRIGSIACVAATVSSPRATIAAGLPLLRRSAIARIAVSIVPSTGFFTARYAASLAERKMRARSSVSASASQAPRTICDRITPELPRAPINAAREISCASPARSSGPSFSSASSIARTVSVRFVPVSPSGTG